MQELTVDKVGMIYKLPNGGSVEALKDVSFNLGTGRILTLLGPSGCGKTTLLNILAGFLAPTSGEASLDKDVIKGPSEDRGMVFQQGALFEWLSVAENVGFGLNMNIDFTEKTVRFFRNSLLNLIRIAIVAIVFAIVLMIVSFVIDTALLSYTLSIIIAFPLLYFFVLPLNKRLKSSMRTGKEQESRKVIDGYLDTVGLAGFGDKAVYELSGGMQQRVALARCLANDPDVILMDEPLGALDALTREKMQSLILKLWKETGKTIILVTHSVEEALFLGDKLFVMAPRPGRIEREYDLPFAEMGLTVNPRELKTSPEFIEKREEILSLIWEMEEQIMNTQGGD